MINLSVIILSYNTKDLLRECLGALFKHIDDKNTEVIVVDNASSDESVSMIKKEFPHVLVLENKNNLGFGAGVNHGAKKAKGRYLLFLNSDALLLDDSIEKLLSFMESEEKAGVVGGMLINSDGKPQRSYGSFYTLFAVTRMLIIGDAGELLGRSMAGPKSVDWVSGGFMLVRKAIFDTIDGFDKHFFMYIEDMELCYRIKKSGYSVYILPEATVVHIGQGSSNRSFAIQHIYQGLRFFYRKHRQPWEYIVLNGLLTIKAIVLIGLGTVMGNNYLVETYKKAMKG